MSPTCFFRVVERINETLRTQKKGAFENQPHPMAVPRGSGSEPRGEGPGPWLWSQAAEVRIPPWPLASVLTSALYLAALLLSLLPLYMG